METAELIKPLPSTSINYKSNIQKTHMSVFSRETLQMNTGTIPVAHSQSSSSTKTYG